MQTMTAPTRTQLLHAVEDVRDAGGTTTHMLHTIARMTAGPAATPDQFQRETASVFAMAGFYYDDLSGEYKRTIGATPYPHETATFDHLTGADQMKVIQHVINEFGDLDENIDLPAPPIALADNLLHCLRKAAALKVESGPHFGPVYTSVRESLVALLATQSVDRALAIESVNRALETGKGIAEAVAYVDGRL
ncbi:hypothetical protein ACGF0J_14325 [Nonomuraea sp. NPDC047897]|uniref:hypothetical protein n=1 Tax=Nonomuraea sp. NPDC047897 TaxID=3364346 RepID=UPI00371439A1